MDEAPREVQIIELFHLAFLQVLQARLDQNNYVLKGGANLRYFFESLRYSEDIDLDAVEIEPWKLEETVDEVLSSSATGLLLRGAGLTVEDVTKPKQTATTQRWKASITVRNRRSPVRTKIEFSHRSSDSRRILEAVPDRVVEAYALRPPTMLHYTAEAAIEQKVLALAKRSETQARDVFDLELLMRRQSDTGGRVELEPRVIDTAFQRVFELPYEAFRDQVIPFLDPGIIDLYDSRGTWEKTQAYVAERLAEQR